MAHVEPSLKALQLRLLSIDWLSQVGEAFEQGWGVQAVAVERPPEEGLTEAPWSRIRQVAVESLRLGLQERRLLVPGQWNRIVRRDCKYVAQNVAPSAARELRRHQLDLDYASDIVWVLGAALVEERFREQVGDGFFSRLLPVYEAGHLPCGWSGPWPEGRLLVY